MAVGGGQTLTTATDYYPARTGPFVVSAGVTPDIRHGDRAERRIIFTGIIFLFVPFINIDLEWRTLRIRMCIRSATILFRIQVSFFFRSALTFTVESPNRDTTILYFPSIYIIIHFT